MPAEMFINFRDADTKWLSWAESRFASIAGKDTAIDRESFKNALEVRNVFFADRFFDLLDKDHSGTVSQHEMVAGLYLLTKGTTEQKIRFFFGVYDLDDDGTIDVSELRRLLRTGMDESSVHLGKEELEHLTTTLFQAADLDSDGSISFNEFMTALRRYPDLMDNFSLSAASWLKTQRKERGHCGRISWLQAGYLRNNIKRIAFMLCFFLVNSALFAQAARHYSFAPDANWCFLIARGCGQALNFSCAVVVLLMLRTTLSFLRSTWMMVALPFDDAVQIHKTVGYVVAALAAIHTLGHVGNALILQTHKDFTAVELLFTNTSILPVGLRVGRLAGSAFITGWILDFVLLVLVLGSLPYVRRSGHFQIFFWTHKICYVVFWFLLILHGPKFWCWFLGPAILFTVEKISQMKIVRIIRFGKTYVKEANLLPSGVTHLVLTRPRHFKYKSGDYIFIQIPVIAKHEWHPFTISSAPEQEDISLHIRSAGNWTKRLYRHFDLIMPATRKKPTRKRSSLWQRVFRSFLGATKHHRGRPATRELDEPSPNLPSSGEVFNSRPLDDDDGYAVVRPPPTIKVRRLSYQARSASSAVLRGRMPACKLQEAEEENVTDSMTVEDVENQDLHQASTADAPASTTNRPKIGKRILVSETNRGHRSEESTRPHIIFDMNTTNKIQVHMQGPYGTPSTSIFHSEHAVLIGAGIGVTPFASIIQSIMCRHRNIINRCPNCQHSWVDEEKSKQALRVRKVDFVWLNRNHTAFEWFVNMLLGLEDQQSQYSLDRLLDIHLYMTSFRRFDMKNVGLQMALDLVHEKDQKDMLTGLRTKLQPGRPDWEKLFQKIKEENKGRVSVFFCGAPALGNAINKYCEQFGFRFHKETF